MMPASRFKDAHLQPAAIFVSGSAKRCINCEHYRPGYTPNRGNIEGWHDTYEGVCTAKDKRKNHLDSCKAFEKLKLR